MTLTASIVSLFSLYMTNWQWLPLSLGQALRESVQKGKYSHYVTYRACTTKHTLELVFFARLDIMMFLRSGLPAAGSTVSLSRSG